MTNGSSRVVLITGASSGIGRATAELLASRGHRIFGGVRGPTTTRQLAGVELVPLDVREEASVKACVEEVLSRAGRIDVLINNAGVNLVGAIEETSIGQAQALFDTNVIGVLRMIQAVLPGMRRQGAGQIVNISSILGLLPAPFMGVYASTKHAIEGLAELLDHEVRPFGIRVVLIEPHYIRTNLDASAAQAEGRIDAYAAQRQRTAAAITHNTNTAPEPSVVAEEVLRSIEGPYRMRRPIGQAALLSWLRRLLPAAMFDPSLRKAFALDPSSKGAAHGTAHLSLRGKQHARFHRNGYHGGLDGAGRQRTDHLHGCLACLQDYAGGRDRRLDRPCRRGGGSRVAHDLKAGSGRRTLRGGAASRRSDRDHMAGGAQGDAKHANPGDGRTNSRVFAVMFLMLATEGRLTGPFPYSAAWGDIITGVVAVPVLWLLKGGGARYTTAIAAWNLFGAADLVLAVAFGVTSAEGSPLQLFPGPGSEAMQHAPWSFVPTVLVPIWLILHAIIAAQLLRVKLGQQASVIA